MQRFVPLFLSFVLVFGACSAGAVSEKSVKPQRENVEDISRATTQTTSVAASNSSISAANTSVSTVGKGKPVSASKPSAPEESIPVERKVIQNADVALESNDTAKLQAAIGQIAQNRGGFVVESNRSASVADTISRDVVSMTIRVPAKDFLPTIEEIKKGADRLIAENIKGDDVTEEFVDVEARLKAKKALEAQIMEIMKRATTVDEALSVQNQLGDVRTEIEKIEGRKRFLENQSSLSTIKISINGPTAFAGNTNGFFARVQESFATGFDVALSFVLGLITVIVGLLPFFVLIVLPLFLLARYFYRKRQKKQTIERIVETDEKINR